MQIKNLTTKPKVHLGCCLGLAPRLATQAFRSVACGLPALAGRGNVADATGSLRPQGADLHTRLRSATPAAERAGGFRRVPAQARADPLATSSSRRSTWPRVACGRNIRPPCSVKSLRLAPNETTASAWPMILAARGRRETVADPERPGVVSEQPAGHHGRCQHRAEPVGERRQWFARAGAPGAQPGQQQRDAGTPPARREPPRARRWCGFGGGGRPARCRARPRGHPGACLGAAPAQPVEKDL